MARARRIVLYAVGDRSYLRRLESQIEAGDHVVHPDRADVIAESVETVYQDLYSDRLIIAVRFRPRPAGPLPARA